MTWSPAANARPPSSTLAAHGRFVAPVDGLVEGRRRLAAAVADDRDDVGRGPRPRRQARVGGLEAVRAPGAPPVGLGRRGAGGNRHLVAEDGTFAAGDLARRPFHRAHRPPVGGDQRDLVERHRRRAQVRDPRRDRERLPRDHHVVVGQRLDVQAVGEAERRLHVARLVGQAVQEIVARGGVEAGGADLVRQRPGPHQHRLQRRQRPLGGVGIEAGPRRVQPRLQGPEVGGEERRRRGVVGREAQQAGERELEAVQHVALLRGGGGDAVEQGEGRFALEGRTDELGDALRAMLRPRHAAELPPGQPEERVVDAGAHGDRGSGALAGRLAADAALVDLAGLPRRKAETGEARRVGGGAERFAREPGRGVVRLAAPRAFEGQGDHDVGAEGPQDAHDVLEGRVVAPAVDVLLDAEGVAEVGIEAEVLLRAVVAVDRGQLLAPQDGERLEELGTEGVLPSVAAGQGEERGAHAQAAGQPHQHPVVLVVGVGGDVQHARRDADPAQGEAEAGGPAVLRDRRQLRGRRSRREGAHEDGRAQAPRVQRLAHRLSKPPSAILIGVTIAPWARPTTSRRRWRR
jgi:hypothetical protein